MHMKDCLILSALTRVPKIVFDGYNLSLFLMWMALDLLIPSTESFIMPSERLGIRDLSFRL